MDGLYRYCNSYMHTCDNMTTQHDMTVHMYMYNMYMYMYMLCFHVCGVCERERG